MSLMALRKNLILRSPQRGRLEGRTALIQPNAHSFTCCQPTLVAGNRRMTSYQWQPHMFVMDGFAIGQDDRRKGAPEAPRGFRR